MCRARCRRLRKHERERGGDVRGVGLLLVWALLLSPSTAWGKVLYGQDNLKEIPVRAGPSNQEKAIAVLKPSQEAFLLGDEGNYRLIVTPKGLRGYVLKSHLTEVSPEEKRTQEVEQRAQQKASELEDLVRTRDKEIVTLREEQSRLEAARQQAEARAQQHADTVARFQAQQSVRESVEALNWFLAGAGVLLVGMLFGRIWGGAARKNKRSGLAVR